MIDLKDKVNKIDLKQQNREEVSEYINNCIDNDLDYKITIEVLK